MTEQKNWNQKQKQGLDADYETMDDRARIILARFARRLAVERPRDVAVLRTRPALAAVLPFKRIIRP